MQFSHANLNAVQNYLFMLSQVRYLKSFNLLLGRVLNGYAGANPRRRPLDKQGPTVVHQKPGPLQTIFNLLPDEVLFLAYDIPD